MSKIRSLTLSLAVIAALLIAQGLVQAGVLTPPMLVDPQPDPGWHNAPALARIDATGGARPAVPAALPTVPLLYDPLVAEMIAQVQQSTVYTYMSELTGETPAIIGGEPYTISTRYTYSGVPIQKATQYLFEHAQALGLSPRYQYWWPSAPNVIGVITGTVRPSEIVLVVGHVDDIAGTPGADDNASASVAVMIAADIMSQYTFERTVRFVWFTGEEKSPAGQLELGSEAYAQYVHGLGENIVAVYNMESIGYDAIGGRTQAIVTRRGNAGDLAIASVFTDVVNIYGLSGSLTPTVYPEGAVWSDHYPFWRQGYNGVMAMGAEGNPYIHTSLDNLAHINLAYLTANVKASLGTVATLAVPSPGPGWLTGTVRDTATTVPLAGARVQVAGRSTLVALTGLDGTYRLPLSPDTYAVTAEAYGYQPATASGVSITLGLTTTQGLALASVPLHTVSGYVRDVNTGRPLSATITIRGDPVQPPAPYNQVWTNPATGYYSTTLAEAVAYTFDVDASASGYLPAQRVVGEVTGNRTEDFNLAVDSVACTAPGYYRFGGLGEPFSTSSAPSGWTVVDNLGNGHVWRFDDPYPRGNETGGSGFFAIADTWYYGFSTHTELRSPVVDLNRYVTATLEFNSDYRASWGGTGSSDVDVSVNGSAGPWTNVWHYGALAFKCGPRLESVDITSIAAGHNNVMVRFDFNNGGLWWGVDNVNIGPTRCEPAHEVYTPASFFNFNPVP